MTWKKEPAITIDTSAKYTMTLATTCGDIAHGRGEDARTP